MLRCKKGDMAIVMHSLNGNTGRLADVGEFLGSVPLDGINAYEDVWAVSYSGEAHNPRTGNGWACPDRYLLPIRPGDLQETEETAKEVESV